MKLIELFDKVKLDLRRGGYVGMDFNMAVLCIISKRTTERKIQFMKGGDSYEQKVEYWASKRYFGEISFDSEDAILKAALEKFSKA